MAINTRYTWTTGCTEREGSAFDLQTVFLHENGHVAGLGHSTDINAVMYPSYRTGALHARPGRPQRASRPSTRPLPGGAGGPVGLQTCSLRARPSRPPSRPRAGSLRPDRVHGVLPAPLRRRVQRALPRLPDADGDGVGPRGDPRALHRARARPAAGAHASRCGRWWARARCCCSRAREHLARRKLMLPPFHGERMRAYEPIVRERRRARDRRAGRRRAVRAAPAHAGASRSR